MIKRTHLQVVHKKYPFTSRGLGKTTYVYDCLLRSAQTHFYNELFYVTSTAKYARESIQEFKKFLHDNSVCFRLNDTINRITIFDYDGTNHKEIDIVFIGFEENKNKRYPTKNSNGEYGIYYFTDFFH